VVVCYNWFAKGRCLIEAYLIVLVVGFMKLW
jgi:hypothetical protein